MADAEEKKESPAKRAEVGEGEGDEGEDEAAAGGPRTPAIAKYSSSSSPRADDLGLVDEPLGVDAAAGEGAEEDAAALSVEVFDPQQHGKGRKAYTSYCILVRDARAGNKPRAAVRRRYTAFEWLYRRLQDDRPGSAVPILPPHRMSPTSEVRYSGDVTAYRRESCERWLNRIVIHPELRDAPSLAEFFGADDSLFAAATEREREEENGDGDGDVTPIGSSDGADDDDDDVVSGGGEDGAAGEDDDERGGGVESAWSSPSPARGKGGANIERSTTAVSAAAKSTTNSTTTTEERTPNKLGGGGGRFHKMRTLAKKVSTRLIVSSAAAVNLEKSPDEYAFVKMEEWTTVAESTVRDLIKQTKAMRASHRDGGIELEVIGSKFAAAGGLKYPLCSAMKSGLFQAILKEAGESSKSVAKVEWSLFDSLRDTVDGPIEELLYDVQSFRNALQRRRELQVDYTSRVNRIEGKEIALEAARTAVGATPFDRAVNTPQQAERVKEAERQLEEVRNQAEARKVLFEECCERVKREAERIRAEFRDGVREVVRTLASAQMEYNAKAGEAFGKLQSSMDLWK